MRDAPKLAILSAASSTGSAWSTPEILIASLPGMMLSANGTIPSEGRPNTCYHKNKKKKKKKKKKKAR